MKGLGLLVSFVLVAWASAGPIDMRTGQFSTCARRCTESNKFKYTPGMTYEHEYHVTTETLMEGANSRKATIQISAIADIEVESKCDFILKLRDVKLYDTSKTHLTFVDHAGRFRRVLERSPLRFSFQDGVIEDLCPADDEDPWALNIKRGILTSLQNSMDNLDRDQTVKETDVTGNCITEYKIKNRGWYSNTISKTKDMMSCTDRHGYRSAIHAIPYRVPSNIQSLPLMKSTHECDHEIDRSGITKNVICHESHIYRPFSNHKSGAVTNVMQKLQYTRQRPTVSSTRGMPWSRAGMNFRHVYGFGNSDYQMNIESKLTELCTVASDDIRPEVPRLFTELVYIMKEMDATAIMDVFTRIQTGAICSANIQRGRKFLLDAIPMAGTPETVEVLKQMLINNVVTGVEVDMWLTSLAFIQNPTREMLVAAKPLIETPDIMMKAMLPVSSLVNNYCEVTSACANDAAVMNIIAVLEGHIGARCYVRNSKIDVTLMALRAIGNAGHVPRIASILNNCVTQTSNPTEVKIAALQAFRRLPCEFETSTVIGLFRDTQEDSEIRIAAYLASMQCPSEYILNIVLETLEHERVDHVGSFVWSHLTNLMETACPHKQAIRAILENEQLKEEFNLERMKYSRNYEASLFLDKFNTGAMLESNLIWSPKSFIPRSAMVNLTIDLFGNSINLFDLGGRVEGLEYLLETYLGPYGYFGNKNNMATASQLDKIKGSMYMRIFGNEMVYQNFNGLDMFGEGKNFNLMNILKKLSDSYDYSTTQSAMFLDSTMIIPTSSGLPLTLAVNGTATVDMKAKGKVDLRKLVNSPRSLELEGLIQPSGAVLISGTMSVDAGVTKTGMRIVNTWHSSTAVKGRVELMRGKILHAEVDVPKEKMEILDVTTAFFTIHGDVEEEEKFLEDSRKMFEVCSGSRMATITGLETCMEFQFINASMVDSAPYFPLTGPFAFGLNIYKRDTHTSYKLLAKRTETKSSSVAQIAFHTPGANVDRTLAFDMTMNYKQKQMEVSLVTPWKKVVFTGSVVNDRDVKKFISFIDIDGKWKYGVSSTLAIERAKNDIIIIPHIEISRPAADNIVLTARVSTDRKRRADISMTISGMTANPIAVKSILENSYTETSAMVQVTTAQQERYLAKFGLIHEKSIRRSSMRIAPTIMIKTPTSTPVSIVGDFEYRGGKSIKTSLTVILSTLLDKPVSFKCDLRRSGMTSERYEGDISINSKYLVAKVNGNFYRKKLGGGSSRLTIDYSLPKHLNIKRNKLTLSSKLQDRSTKSLTKYSLNANLDSKTTPHLNFQADMDFSHSRSKFTGAGATIRYGGTHEISGLASITHRVKSNQASIEYNMKGKSTAHDIDFSILGDHKQDKKILTSSIDMKYGRKQFVKAALNLKDDSSKKLAKMSGDFSLGYPGKSIFISSDLTQPSHKEYTHNINIKYDKTKSIISTSYRRPSKTSHSIKSDFVLPFMKPIRFVGMTDLDPTDLKLSGHIDHDNDAYGLTTKYKYVAGPKGKWSMDISYPSRHIEMEVEGERIGSQFAGKIDTRWDADRDRKQRMMFYGKVDIPSLSKIDSSFMLKYLSRTMQLKMRHNADTSYATHAEFSWLPHKQIVLDASFAPPEVMGNGMTRTTLSLQTPFRSIKDVAAEITTENNSGHISAKTSLSWDRKVKEITAVATISKPISWQYIDMTMTVTTPWRHFRTVNFGIMHRLDTRLKTVVKGFIDGRKAQLEITGQNTGNYRMTHVESTATFRSNIPNVESIAMKMLYHTEPSKMESDITVDINGQQYIVDVDMYHVMHGYQIQNIGKLRIVAGPHFSIVNNWNHLNTDKAIKTILNSDWGRGNILQFNMEGNHDTSVRATTTGTLNIRTPWRKMQDISVDMSHEFGTGFIHNRAHYTHNGVTIIQSTVNYIASPGSMEFDIMVTTPWMENISGKLKTHTASNPMTGFVEIEWSPYKKITAHGSLMVISMTHFDGEMRITTPYMPAIMIKASQISEGSELISRGTVEYGIRKYIKFESRVMIETVKKVWIKIETPFENYRNIETGIEFSGALHDFNSKGELTISPMFGTMKGLLTWHYMTDLKANMRIETPMESFPYLQVSLTSTETARGWRTFFETEYSPRQIITVDTTIKMTHPYVIEAQINTPFVGAEHISVLLQHTWRTRFIQTHLEARYGDYKRIEGDMRITWTTNSADITFAMKPFIDNAVLHIDYLNKPHGFGGNVRAVVGQIIEAAGTVTVSSTSSMVTVEIKGDYRMETVQSKVVLSVQGKILDPEIQMDIVAGINDQIIDIALMMTKAEKSYGFGKFDFLHGIKTMKITIRTPFTEDITVNVQSVSLPAKSVRKIWGSYGQESTGTAMWTWAFDDTAINAEFEAEVRHLGRTRKAVFNIKTNIEATRAQIVAVIGIDHQTVEASYLVTYARGMSYATTPYAMIKAIQSIEIIIKNPYTENIVLNLEKTISPTGFEGKIIGSIGSTTKVIVNLKTIFSSTSISIESEAEYTIRNIHQKATLTITASDNGTRKNINFIIGANDKTIEITASTRITDGFHGELNVKTPFDSYRHTALTVHHTSGHRTIDSEFSIRFMNGKVVNGKISHYYDTWHNIKTDIELTTPFTGYEKTKASYKHSMGDNAITGTAHIAYGTGRMISTNMKIMTSPSVEYEFTLHTPFVGYEEMTITGEFTKLWRKYAAHTVMKINQGRSIGFRTTIDLADTPMKVYVMITTPITNFETTELTLTHGGPWSDFKSTAHFKTPYTNSVKAEAVFRYATLFDFDWSVLFDSNIPYMKHIKLVTTTTERNGNYRIHNEITWAPRRQIITDITWESQNAWGRKESLIDIAFSSPFHIARQFTVKYEIATETGKFTQKIEAEINGHPFLDIDVEYTLNTRHEGSLIIRHPYPMHFTVSGLNTDKGFDGDMMLNWNKNEPHSNVRFQTEYESRAGHLNKNFGFKVIHPTRTVGILGKLKHNPRHASSMGELTWDEDTGHKLSYDVSFNDRSRRNQKMYDSSLKFGIPGRSVQMTGTFENNKRTKTMGGSFFWDADKDQTKEIGFNAIVVPSESKADITFRLPSIGKDVTIETKMRINEGRTIFNGRTALSYSMDSSKTWTFISTLEDVSTGYGSTNYSLVLGMFHPYTDLDCQLSGNIGQSTEKYSAMMDVKYLTTRRENVNLALRAEINRLRNQMNLEMISPKMTMEIDGEILNTNPLKMKLINKINNWKVMKSAITIDPAKKLFDLETNYDTENPDRKIQLIARYIDSNTIQADIAHTVNYQEHKDALVTMRLNTSHILHTRIMWKPDVLAHFQNFMTAKIQNIEQMASIDTRATTTAIGNEIEARYLVTVNHIEHEAAPFVKLLDSEISILLSQLKYINAEIKNMYDRNDYYMHTIGTYFWIPVNICDDIITKYVYFLRTMSGGFSEIFETLKSYPIKEAYYNFVHDYINTIESLVSEAVAMAVEMIDRLDDALLSVKDGYYSHAYRVTNHVKDYWNTFINHPWLQTPHYSWAHYNNYVNTVANTISNGIRSTGLHHHYYAIIHNTKHLIHTGLAHVITDEDVEHLHNMVNNAYQQGIWAYYYWNIEDNLQKYAKEFFTLVTEVIMDEVKREFSLAKVLQESRVTVYDPVHGEIQFDIYLPFPVQSLETIPRIVPYLTRTRNSFTRYIPSITTIKQYYNDYAPTVLSTSNISSYYPANYY